MTKRNKRVFTAGYYGMLNTGDDALLAATCWGAIEYLGVQQIHATATVVPDIRAKEIIIPIYKPKQFIRGSNRIRECIRAYQSEGIIFGGGSVFHSARYLNYMRQIIRLAGKKYRVALGIGVGPFSNISDEVACKNTLNEFDFIGVRDRDSYDIVKYLSPNTECKLTFDLAPLMLNIYQTDIDDIFQQKERKGLGISLCYYERYVAGDVRCDVKRQNNIIASLNRLDQHDVDEIVFIDFNGHPHFGDREIHQYVASKLKKSFKIRHVSYSANPLHALYEISKLKALIAMRLHSGIFAYLVGTPAIYLAYHKKCLEWASEVGVAKEYVFDGIVSDTHIFTDMVLNALAGEYKKPQLAISEAKRRALSNWTWVKNIT